ncbi:MAG: MFS transporter [Actinomycetia bacterium]|nr:MFS transporter [Actinomycetes bacterium]
MNKKTKRQTLITFYFIFVLFGLSIIIIDPLIPIIAEGIDVGFDRIGIALFIGSIAALIANFIAGRLSDRVDIKKLVLLGLFFLFLGFALFGTYLNFIIFIIVTIFLRIGFGTIDTSVHAFSSKLFKKDMSSIFLKLDIAWYSGAVMGPLVISGILYFEFLPGYFFLILAFVYLVFIAVFYKICPKKKILDNNSSQNKNIPGSHENSLRILKDPAVIMGSLILFFFMGSIMGLSTWMTTYFLSFGIRVAYGSAILSAYWLFSIIGMIVATGLVAKYKEINILFYSCLAGITCLAIFSFIPFVYIKIAALSLQAIFFAAIFPLTNAIAANRDPKNSGTILGFTIAFAFAGSIVFQPLYGYIAEYFGREYIAYIALGGTLIGFIFVSMLFGILKKEHNRRSVWSP